MIVRTTDEITGTEREVADPLGNWVSKRIVLGGDGVGFSFHETTIAAGSVNEFHYANHIEAVWLVEGRARSSTGRPARATRCQPAACTCSTGTSATRSSSMSRCA